MTQPATAVGYQLYVDGTLLAKHQTRAEAFENVAYYLVYKTSMDRDKARKIAGDMLEGCGPRGVERHGVRVSHGRKFMYFRAEILDPDGEVVSQRHGDSAKIARYLKPGPSLHGAVLDPDELEHVFRTHEYPVGQITTYELTNGWQARITRMEDR